MGMTESRYGRNFSDTTPAAPGAGVNVKWQQSGATASAYIDEYQPCRPRRPMRRNSSTAPRRRLSPSQGHGPRDDRRHGEQCLEHETRIRSEVAGRCDAIPQRRRDAGLRASQRFRSRDDRRHVNNVLEHETRIRSEVAGRCDAIPQRRGDAGLRRKSKIPTSRSRISRRTTSPSPSTVFVRRRRTMRRNSSTVPARLPSACNLWDPRPRVTSRLSPDRPASPIDLTGDVTTSGTAATTIAAGAVTESKIGLSDVTTDNVSITKHGFAPKAPNDATKFLDGTGAFSTPSAGSLSGSVNESQISLSDITTDNVSSTAHGFAPKSPADATKFLNGAATPAKSPADARKSRIRISRRPTSRRITSPSPNTDLLRRRRTTQRSFSTGPAPIPFLRELLAPTPVEEEVVSFTGTAGTLAHTPSTSSGYNKVKLYRNGQRLLSGAGNDFTRSGANITLATAAGGSDVFVADYWQ
jgi:hypothetical protein